MKVRVLMLVLLLSSRVLGSLKLVTDGETNAPSAHQNSTPGSTSKDTKKVGLTQNSHNSAKTSPWTWQRKLQLRRRGTKKSRGRAGRGGRRRPAVGRAPRQEPITRGGRFVADAVLLDIHRRSLRSAFADPRAGNVRQRPGTECDLYAEFEPMFYTTITRTASTVIHFSSNCMRTASLNVENVFGANRNINWAYHPRKMYLNIVGNLYEVTYSRPRVIDRRDIIRSLRYSRVNVGRTFGAPRNIRLGSRNSVYLAPQVRNSMTANTLRRFARLRGYWRCQTRPRRFRNYALRIRRRRAQINKLRRQGFSNHEISRLIKGALFGPRVSPNHNLETPEEVAGIAPVRTTRRNRRRRTRRRPRRQRRPAQAPRPRNLEVKEVGGQANANQFSGSDSPTESGAPDRKMQGSIVQQVQNEIAKFTRGRVSPQGTRARRRGRRGTRRTPRPRRQVSQFEREEERQRLEERRFIRSRLRNNFIWELVTVCTLR